MTTHELKYDQKSFEAVLSGDKLAEIRFNDRDFQVGDDLVLQETQHTGYEMRQGKPLIYTGRTLARRISHIQTGYGLAYDWVSLSLSKKAA